MGDPGRIIRRVDLEPLPEGAPLDEPLPAPVIPEPEPDLVPA
jgi:hypothetical protein